MGAPQRRASLRTKQIENIGKRMVELANLLGFENLQQFSNECLIEPNSIQRLLRNSQHVPSFELLARIVVVFPQVNVNWLISGHGPPLVDWDKLHLQQNLEALKNTTYELMTTVNDTINDLATTTHHAFNKMDKLPSTWNELKLKELNGEAEIVRDKRYAGLGRMQLAALMWLEKGYHIERRANVFTLVKGKNNKGLINYGIAYALEQRGFVKKIEPNKWIYDATTIEPDGRSQNGR